MKKFFLAILITTVISFGFTSFYVNAMTVEHPSEHPTVEKTKSGHSEAEESKMEHPTSEEVKSDHVMSEEAALERLMSEDQLAADKKSRVNKPKDHPAH
ncbi:MAG: hypothetical protein V1882_02165 [Candidatus Omnitrophota bacterium]